MSTVTLPEGMTQDEFDRLSPEEQASVGVELDDRGPVVKVEQGSDEEKRLEAEKDATNAKLEADKVAAAAKKAADDKVAADAKAATDAKAASDAKAAEDAKAALAAGTAAAAPAKEAPAAAEGAVPDTEDPHPIVPSFKAGKIVTDEEHAAAQAALSKKFEDGEVTTPQFILENDKLTRAKLESDLAVRSSAQNEELSWQTRQDAFFNTPGNEIIRDDPRVWAAMQAQLETMYADPKCKDFSDMDFLNGAGREVRKLFGIEPVAAAPAAAAASVKKPAGTAVDVPTTLSDVPAAAENLDGGNEFAYMDKLDGMEYELAIAKMSNEQKARFLAI